MQNYRVLLQYEGTRYQGWQKQESTDNTIQGKLELLLEKMLGCKTQIQASGRTDTGVHALGQVANFHAQTSMSEKEILDYMNQYLPEDIAVISVEKATERFHSRLHAKGKTYCYRVVNSHIPHLFDRRYVHVVTEPLDLEAMRIAAAVLLGTHDFKAFTSNKRSKKSTLRTIEEIKIERCDGRLPGVQGMQDELQFTFSGNGFLYHMVRIIMGTLLEIGLHKRKPEEMAEILASGIRENAGELAPAKGLTLMEVRY